MKKTKKDHSVVVVVVDSTSRVLRPVDPKKKTLHLRRSPNLHCCGESMDSIARKKKMTWNTEDCTVLLVDDDECDPRRKNRDVVDGDNSHWMLQMLKSGT